jgi:hypothetical protein
MNEKLLHDYWKENGAEFSKFTVDIRCSSGGVVIFQEQNEEGWEFKQIAVDVFDIVAWVYSKQVTAQKTTKVEP